jgi:hypothetical protein
VEQRHAAEQRGEQRDLARGLGPPRDHPREHEQAERAREVEREESHVERPRERRAAECDPKPRALRVERARERPRGDRPEQRDRGQRGAQRDRPRQPQIERAEQRREPEAGHRARDVEPVAPAPRRIVEVVGHVQRVGVLRPVVGRDIGRDRSAERDRGQQYGECGRRQAVPMGFARLRLAARSLHGKNHRFCAHLAVTVSLN